MEMALGRKNAANDQEKLSGIKNRIKIAVPMKFIIC
jgi:hypothetical protein